MINYKQTILNLLDKQAYPVFLWKDYSIFVLNNKIIFLNPDKCIKYDRCELLDSFDITLKNFIIYEWNAYSTEEFIDSCQEFICQAGENYIGNLNLLIDAMVEENWHFIREFGELANNDNLTNTPERFINYYYSV